MFSVTVTRKTRNLEKLLAKMEKLAKENVETGVFVDQGEHPNAGMSYVDLAVMHEEGDGDFPPRTVRPLILNAMSNNPFLSKMNKHLKSYLLGDNSLNYALSYIGQDMRDLGKGYLGEINPPDMPQNSPYTVTLKGGRNTPLVDEGHLSEAWAYRTSINNIVVEG